MPAILPLKEIFPRLSSPINFPNLKFVVVIFPEYREALLSGNCMWRSLTIVPASVISVPDVTKSFRKPLKVPAKCMLPKVLRFGLVTFLREGTIVISSL